MMEGVVVPLNALTRMLDATVVSGDGAVLVSDIVYDSRAGRPGVVFVALPSKLRDGHDFIADAYDRGVRAFVVERGTEAYDDVTVVRVGDTHHALALMSQCYFGFPERELTIVAVTGTKGKTTTSYMLQAICQAAGRQVGLIGSNGITFAGRHSKSPNTTPESYLLQQAMAEMVAAGVETLIMETTSQGFLMGRTDGIRFSLGVFTNISPDHISALEHSSFDEYFTCKKKLFSQAELCCVNADAELYEQIVAGADCPIQTYGTTNGCDCQATDITLTWSDQRLLTTFTARTKRHSFNVELGVPGFCNVSNALAAIAVADQLAIPVEAIQAGLAQVRVPGRMEIVEVPAPYTVLIDFAHNQLSIRALLDTAKAYRPRRILAVFGLEGDRTHLRRWDCGQALGRDVAHTILADASPRYDDPDRILADIAAGIEQGGGSGRYEIIRDRRQAIPAILDMAQPGDLILLVGKGNVMYEEVCGNYFPIDERQIVRDYFTSESNHRPPPDRPLTTAPGKIHRETNLDEWNTPSSTSMDSAPAQAVVRNGMT